LIAFIACGGSVGLFIWSAVCREVTPSSFVIAIAYIMVSGLKYWLNQVDLLDPNINSNYFLQQYANIIKNNTRQEKQKCELFNIFIFVSILRMCAIGMDQIH
jgi:hypothetical protein